MTSQMRSEIASYLRSKAHMLSDAGEHDAANEYAMGATEILRLQRELEIVEAQRDYWLAEYRTLKRDVVAALNDVRYEAAEDGSLIPQAG